MEFPSNKCSSEEHKQEVNAIKYCPECKKSFCKKCDDFIHGNFFKNHKTYPLDKDVAKYSLDFANLKTIKVN